MMSSHSHKATPSHFVGLVLLCTLTAVGCSKKSDSEEGANQTQVDNVLVPVVACDDRLVASQLEQAVKASINTQAQRQFNAYAQAAGEVLSSNKVITATNAILVDIANPTMIQEANEQGMVTCQANLSLTLPNQDIVRASQVYSALESRDLADVLQSQGIVLNNNMLVTNDFSYVVGMQGAQTKSRLVSQSNIIAATADMIAKSQFQSTLDANLGVPKVRQPRPEPALPKEPSVRSEPQIRPDPEPRSSGKANTAADKPSTEKTTTSSSERKARVATSESAASNNQVGPSKNANVELNKATPRSQTPSQGPAHNEPTISLPTANASGNKAGTEKAPTSNTKEKKDSGNSRQSSEPKNNANNSAVSLQDDDIDVVIVEEEGTY